MTTEKGELRKRLSVFADDKPAPFDGTTQDFWDAIDCAINGGIRHPELVNRRGEIIDIVLEYCRPHLRKEPTIQETLS